MALIIPAFKECLKLVVLDGGGLYTWPEAFTETDMINNITRIRFLCYMQIIITQGTK